MDAEEVVVFRVVLSVGCQGFTSHRGLSSHRCVTKEPLTGKPADLVEIDGERDGDGIARSCRFWRGIERYGNIVGVDRCSLQVVSNLGLHGRGGRSIQNGLSCSFSRCIGEDLLNHDHSPVFDHAEDQHEDHGSNESELDS